MTLTQDEIEHFKRELEKLRDQLTHSLSTVSEEVKTAEESKGYSQHQADEGTDDFNQCMSIKLSTKGQKVIKQISRALEKIEEKTYGVCDVSGEEIPKKRLEAIPYATTTIEVQAEIEKKGLVEE